LAWANSCTRHASAAAPPVRRLGIEDHLRTDLVETALRRGVTLRGEFPGKVIFHADTEAANTPSNN
jgi:hypothetical protein